VEGLAAGLDLDEEASDLAPEMVEVALMALAVEAAY
jgi:hypothetical protein